MLLPDSKGLGEFTADGSRYAQFRQAVKKQSDKLTERETDVAAREQNLQRGLQQMEATVARYQQVEQLLDKAKTDDDTFVAILEQRTGKKLNDVMKRRMEKSLGKETDPEVVQLRNELRQEREAREARERQEQEARQQGEQREKIQRHLVFLDDTLSKSQDPRVVALVKTPEGMRAIFEAQRAHYDQRTGVTLSPEQAAQFVLSEKQKELEPWQRVFGGAPAAASGPPPGPAAAPRARPLPRQASASNGGRKLSDPELFEKYERLARLPG